MPGRVETLACFVEPLWIEIGVENALLVPQRPGEIGPVRRKNGRAPAAHDVVAVCERYVGRITRSALVDATAENERARLAGDVLHRVVPVLRVVGRRCEIDLDSALVA